MFPRPFDYLAPTAIEEALQALAGTPGAKVISGGMSLLPLMKMRLVSPPLLVDIGRLPGLGEVAERGKHVAVGALVRHARVAVDPLVARHAGALGQAAAWTGDVQVRNRGTTCGALAHADAAGDQCGAALALGAVMVARSVRGVRRIPAEQFFVDTLTSALEADEVLVEVLLSKAGRGEGCAYEKFGRRGWRRDFPVVGAAAWVRRGRRSLEAARVALTGLAVKPVLAAGVAAALIGSDGSVEAIEAASARAVEGLRVLGDLHGSEDYKAHLARVVVRRALVAAVDSAATGGAPSFSGG